MNVWRTLHVHQFHLTLCLSFFGRLEGRMLLRPYPTGKKGYFK